jgi:hypothetical protein
MSGSASFQRGEEVVVGAFRFVGVAGYGVSAGKTETDQYPFVERRRNRS